MKNDIELTQSAATRITKQLASDEKALGLRFIVKESGCSGYSYFMELAHSIEDNEKVLNSQGVQIVTNEESLELIRGIKIDYVQEGLNQTFKFINPKAEAHCGCGESFAV